MDTRARLTSKGQVTIPKSVREALDLHEGDELLFRVERSRAVLAKTPDFLELGGAVTIPAGKRGNTVGRGPSPHPDRASEAGTLSAFLDTNVLIRHLTGDPPKLASRATAILTEPGPLLLADLILAECVYVLESFYEVKPARVAELMRSALAMANIETVDTGLLLRALEGLRGRSPRLRRGIPGRASQDERRRRDRLLRPIDRPHHKHHPTTAVAQRAATARDGTKGHRHCSRRPHEAENPRRFGSGMEASEGRRSQQDDHAGSTNPLHLAERRQTDADRRSPPAHGMQEVVGSSPTSSNGSCLQIMRF